MKNGELYDECECQGEKYEEWSERRRKIKEKREQIHDEIKERQEMYKYLIGRNNDFEKAWQEIEVIPKKFQKKRFENFEVNDENKQGYRYCKKYADNYQKIQNDECGKGLFLYGPVGVGKTHLAYSVIRQVAIENIVKPESTSSIELFAELSPMNEDSQRRKAKDRIKNAELLLFDDIGTHRLSDWVTERIMEIVDYRYKKELPMILTSNKSLDEMDKLEKKHPGWQPIVDRLAEVCEDVKIEGESKRIE